MLVVWDMYRTVSRGSFYGTLSVKASTPIYRRNFISLPFSNEQEQSHKVSKLISAKELVIFDVISDVQSYKQFIPFLEDSFVTERDGNGYASEAGLQVGWKQYDERFVCKLTCTPHQSVIAESITTSVFDSLYTEWRLTPVKSRITHSGDLTNCELTLKYKFKNPLYNTVSSMFADQVTSIMIKAFETRVRQVIFQKSSLEAKSKIALDK